jgi:hypothetical protein
MKFNYKNEFSLYVSHIVFKKSPKENPLQLPDVNVFNRWEAFDQ